MSTTFRIAIFGSGPSGFYAADALLKHTAVPIEVDLFDRLPTPFGLVRGGVAPDHASIKSVTKLYEKIATHPGFRFFGGVELGKHIQVSDLAEHYDGWIYAVGAACDRKLGVPGEHLRGSHSATEFVGWYNGHPDFRDYSFDLSARTAVIVGVGNVAMDVARILAQDPTELHPTDIASHAIEVLRSSKIEEIIILGRRGIAQAAFSPQEIKEIGELSYADLIVRSDDVQVDDASEAELADANTKKNIDYLTKKSLEAPTGKPRQVKLRFKVSPVELIGNEQVTAVRIEKNQMIPGPNGVSAKGTGEIETIPAGLVFRSVGYSGVAIPGVAFDSKRCIIPNRDGRVVDPDSGELRPREYVVGWAKRGPSGLIGTNRGDAIATVNQLLADLAAQTPITRDKMRIQSLLKERSALIVEWNDWKRIDAAERAAGTTTGKTREKFTRIPEMYEQLK